MTQLVRYVDCLTEFEKRCVQELKTIINRQLENELEEYWNIGVIVCDIYKKAEEFISKHGRKAAEAAGMLGPHRVKLVAKELGVNPKTLMDAARLVERWETKDRFLEVVNLSKIEGQKALTFAHFKELSRFDDDDFVIKKAKEAAEKSMSARELQAHLANLEGKGKPRGPGRKPKVPNNFESCLINIKTTLTAVERKVKSVWFGDEFNLLVCLSDIDPEVFREDVKLYDTLVDVIGLLNKVGNLLTDYGEKLTELFDEISYVFDKNGRKEEEHEEELDDWLVEEQE